MSGSGGSRDRRWSRIVSSGKRIGPMPEPPPTPRELISVVGVGQTETVNGVALTLLSLERYREADIVTFRLTHRRGMHLDFPSPELFITIATGDDSPVRRISMMGGSGGGDRQERGVLYSSSFAPPLPQNAPEDRPVVGQIASA